MHRNHILNYLSQYQNNYPDETLRINEFKSFINKNPRCFERGLLQGHITASALLIHSDRKRALLLFHKKLQKWLQPGGHCSGDNNVFRVAFKEVCEETSICEMFSLQSFPIDIDRHWIPPRQYPFHLEPGHYHYDIRFLFQVKQEAAAKINHESEDYRWVDLNAITKPAKPEWPATLKKSMMLNLENESIQRMVRKAIKVLAA